MSFSAFEVSTGLLGGDFGGERLAGAALVVGRVLALLPRRPAAFFDSVSILPFAPTCRSFARVTFAPWRRILLSSLNSTSPPRSVSISPKISSTAATGTSNPSSLIAFRNSFLSTLPEPSRSHCLKSVMTRAAERFSESRNE